MYSIEIDTVRTPFLKKVCLEMNRSDLFFQRIIVISKIYLVNKWINVFLFTYNKRGMSVMKPVKKAIIPAAGLGTRFLPVTKAMPKEMLPIVDKPTIQYIVEEAIQSGIEDIIVVTGKGKRAIEDHFDYAYELEQTLYEKGKFDLLERVKNVSEMVNIHYIRQKEPKGLGHAIWCARKFIGNEPFAVLLGDDIVESEIPCIKQLMNVYEKTGSSIVGVQQVPYSETSRYGIIDPLEEIGRYV